MVYTDHIEGPMLPVPSTLIPPIVCMSMPIPICIAPILI